MVRGHMERGGVGVTSTSKKDMGMIRTVRTRWLMVLALVALVAGAVATPAGARPKHDRFAAGTTSTDAVATDGESTTQPEAYDAVGTLGSLHNVVDQINARALWQQGITGAGVDVAVIDTGVAPVAALSDPDKVAAVVDLSFESDVPELTYLDSYGHGTHIAGIIAGREPGVTAATAAPDDFLGVAPDARIVSVKVGDNTGAVDVSQVIAGIDWVIQHRNTGDLDIRVLNLSYGTDSLQASDLDPLSKAVENAWDHGIVVVAAAGNDGWQRNDGLTMPARNRNVIAVGAAEATEWGMTIPDWASPGEYSTGKGRNQRQYWQDGYTGRIPDVIAPGASIDSLRVPGSRVDLEHPEGRVDDVHFRGSGSSQSAAVVSGAAALLLQHRPELTPDQVKALLMAGAEPVPNWGAVFQGDGVIDVATSAALPTPDALQTHPASSGLGSLEESRGSQHVVLDGVVLEGEVTAWGATWDPHAWLEAVANGTSWTGGVSTEGGVSDAAWAGNSWTGNSWTGNSWTGNSWTGLFWG